MVFRVSCSAVAPRRTPQGVRGLKSHFTRLFRGYYRRTPQGVRGLKWVYAELNLEKELVAPRKGCVD